MQFKSAVAKYFPDYDSYAEYPDTRHLEFELTLEGDEAIDSEALLCLVRLLDAGYTTYRRTTRMVNQGGCGQSDCCGEARTIHETHIVCEEVRFNEWDPPTEKHEIVQTSD